MNEPKLNNSRTECIIFATNLKLGKLSIASVSVGNENTMDVKEVQGIDAYLNSVLKWTFQLKTCLKVPG